MLGLVLAGAALPACEDFAGPEGKSEALRGLLRWKLESVPPEGKATEELPDTNDYLLTIQDASGQLLYEGSWGDSPQALEVEEGYYTVKIVSIPFSAPAFSRPQYGDEQVVRVPAGGDVTVRLACTLRNAGIRLKTGPDFLSAFPDGILYVEQDGVKLKYQYRETRIAYLFPGLVSVLLYNLGQWETLLTRTLEAREVLTLSISAPAASGSTAGRGSITVQTDTTKVWETDSFVIGENDSADEPLSVGEAAAHAGENGRWVTGYIVGGDLSTTGTTVKTSGIGKNTHIALAARSSVTDKSACLAVELPQGKVRDALNLVDHPGLIGKRVKVKGNLVDKYFGTTGMKSTSQYELL